MQVTNGNMKMKTLIYHLQIHFHFTKKVVFLLSRKCLRFLRKVLNTILIQILTCQQCLVLVVLISKLSDIL